VDPLLYCGVLVGAFRRFVIRLRSKEDGGTSIFIMTEGQEAES
jgi:hypothetical protein